MSRSSHPKKDVELAPGQQITLSPGEHSTLTRAIIEDFAPRFAPGSVLVYVGDTGEKWAYFDAVRLAELGGSLALTRCCIHDVILSPLRHR